MTPPSSPHAAKRLARLAAVQALYQSGYEQQPPAQIVRDMIAQKFAALGDEGDPAFPAQPDAELFTLIVTGVAEHGASIDEILAGALDPRFALNRMELLLKVILRCGVFELLHNSAIPTGVIINDYIDVTRAFYNAKEPGLVNGILDRLAGKLREDQGRT